ncbi:MAG: lipocalin family protein [Flavobacteriaceae bacterium]|jgi:hypothetical protein|nr:lipocalin family protein [Flavobacteriaceae bacterium]
MKKILLTALSSIVLCLSFAACSGDDDSTPAVTPTPLNSEKLIGKWYHEKELALDANGKVVSVDSLNLSYFVNLGPNGSFISIDSISCPSSIIDFKADGTWENTHYEYRQGKCEPEIGNGKWSVNGNTLTVENNDVEEGEEEIETVAITKLSDDTFEIEIPLSKGFAGDYKPNVVKLRNVYKKL